jgi:hypothetical protein
VRSARPGRDRGPRAPRTHGGLQGVTAVRRAAILTDARTDVVNDLVSERVGRARKSSRAWTAPDSGERRRVSALQRENELRGDLRRGTGRPGAERPAVPGASSTPHAGKAPSQESGVRNESGVRALTYRVISIR